jgi:O-antigen/teichoic acid export membrane protein
MSLSETLSSIQRSAQDGVGLRRAGVVVARYGISTFGPLSVAGSHFLTSLFVLHALSPADFGHLSFVLVVVPLCLSVTGALFGAPMSSALCGNRTAQDGDLAIYLKGSFLFALLAGVGTFASLVASGAGVGASLLFAGYALFMVVRWFARSYAFVESRMIRVIASDLAYSVPLVAAIGIMFLTKSLTLMHAGIAFLICGAVALLPFGLDYLSHQVRSLRRAPLGAYGGIWRDLTRWSLLGVVSTELTANAHAYLVTFFSGSHAFALLAVGSLFMRPVSLVLTALPDLERPVIARHLAAGHMAQALRVIFEFRAVTVAIWFGTIGLIAAILHWAPGLILKSDYNTQQVLIAIGFWAAIMAVRILRTPEAVLLQATGDFKALASASLQSSVVSLVFTLALLVLVGPVASLGGILLGDLVMTQRIFARAHRWKKGHARSS